MLCQNCKHNEATVKYTQIINGKKQEMRLCEECSKELGIDTSLNFSMPIDFSSFLGDFISDFGDTEFMPLLTEPKELKCSNCNMSYEEFLSLGKLGCSDCYTTFENQMDQVLKRIHGTNKHNGKKFITKNKSEKKEDIKEKEETNDTKIQRLQQDLKQAIKEERYEDAAKIRDEIKKMS